MTMKLDPLKRGDITVLELDDHKLVFIAGAVRGLYQISTRHLQLSADIESLDAPDRNWHQWAMDQAVADPLRVTSIEQIHLANCLHVKSLRTIKHELANGKDRNGGPQIGNDKVERAHA